MNTYEIVTERIINVLEQGVVVQCRIALPPHGWSRIRLPSPTEAAVRQRTIIRLKYHTLVISRLYDITPLQVNTITQS